MTSLKAEIVYSFARILKTTNATMDLKIIEYSIDQGWEVGGGGPRRRIHELMAYPWLSTEVGPGALLGDGVNPLIVKVSNPPQIIAHTGM